MRMESCSFIVLAVIRADAGFDLRSGRAKEEEKKLQMRPVSSYKSHAHEPARLRTRLPKSMCMCAYADGGHGQSAWHDACHIAV